MEKVNLIRELPYAAGKELSTLVENRKAYTLNNFELNVFETYEVSNMVPLKFDDIVIINMLKGKKIMHLEDVPAFDYMPGETLILPASKPMEIDFPEARMKDPTQCTALVISSEKINESLNFLNDNYPKTEHKLSWDFSWDKFHISNTSELATITNKLFAAMISTDPFKDALSDLLFKELLIRIIQQQQFERLKEPESDNLIGPMGPIKKYIQEHLTEKLTVEVLCQQMDMSKAGLFRLFKEEYGISPMELVIQERLEKAKDLLRTNLSVKEVCYACGFNDVNYFVRLFRSRTGITPGLYQKDVRFNAS